jgi:hypothetical protein
VALDGPKQARDHRLVFCVQHGCHQSASQTDSCLYDEIAQLGLRAPFLRNKTTPCDEFTLYGDMMCIVSRKKDALEHFCPLAARQIDYYLTFSPLLLCAAQHLTEDCLRLCPLRC